MPEDMQTQVTTFAVGQLLVQTFSTSWGRLAIHEKVYGDRLGLITIWPRKHYVIGKPKNVIREGSFMGIARELADLILTRTAGTRG